MSTENKASSAREGHVRRSWQRVAAFTTFQIAAGSPEGYSDAWDRQSYGECRVNYVNSRKSRPSRSKDIAHDILRRFRRSSRISCANAFGGGRVAPSCAQSPPARLDIQRNVGRRRHRAFIHRASNALGILGGDPYFSGKFRRLLVCLRDLGIRIRAGAHTGTGHCGSPHHCRSTWTCVGVAQSSTSLILYCDPHVGGAVPLPRRGVPR